MRLRLTLLYGGLFLLCGAGLLAITYLLVQHFSGHVSLARYGPVAHTQAPAGRAKALPKLPSVAQLQESAQHDLVRQHASDLHQLLTWSGVALAVTALASLAVGWLVAGRVLSPLRTMTTATRRISQDNLHERLALGGPDDELKELGDTIDGLLSRLETAFEAQRRFVANASHELRTPLARIRTALDVAVGKPAPPPEVKALDLKIRDGLDRADRLLDSFLALGRAQHGELSDRCTVPLQEVVSATLSERRSEIAARRLEVDQRLREVAISGSPTLLSRMIENVIDNAVRHNSTDGWMQVELEELGDRARLTVQSSGAVLQASQVRQLAQPFRRLTVERTGSENGVGLGLSIVEAIASAHSGTLQLDPRPDGGLRVVIELPHTANGTGTGSLA